MTLLPLRWVMGSGTLPGTSPHLPPALPSPDRPPRRRTPSPHQHQQRGSGRIEPGGGWRRAPRAAAGAAGEEGGLARLPELEGRRAPPRPERQERRVARRLEREWAAAGERARGCEVRG